MNCRPALAALRRLYMRLAWSITVTLAGCIQLAAQAPSVPIHKQGRHESEHEAEIGNAAKEIFSTSNVVKLAAIENQLKRASCQLDLPKVNSTKLSAREICIAARRSHLRVGWAYLCDKCDDWHVNLAGGYLLTTNGAVATCYHVVKPDRQMRDGCLVAADENGTVLPVAEVLAANRNSDACIVRVTGKDFRPLPLNTNVYPGDVAYCYSDPLDHRGYFSDGIVNRFYQFPGRRPFGASPSTAFAPMRINVSTDWAPGSSGSAVLDEFGNAIGHVSTIAAMSDEGNPDVTDASASNPMMMMMIVFHEAVSARDVLLLIEQRK
jgi:hypothetical protein